MFDLLEQWNVSGMRCLIIGAHALSFCGVTRETADLDLLISRSDRTLWEVRLREAGYELFAGTHNFAQFSPPARGAWPVDLMLVDEETFSRMLADARTVVIAGNSLAVPAMEHLLALKLHALKHTHPRRTVKDFQDVVELIRANRDQLDIESDRVRRLFEKYATIQWYEKVRTTGG
jgi:predicted nucleotidyltransferase